MGWYWWVLIVLVMYGMGMVGAKAFEKSHPPDRRKGDRRKGDRRESDGRHVRSRADGPDRRRADRRVRERRRPRPIWPASTIVVSAAFLAIIGVVSYAETQVQSIFVESQPELIGSGWADCDTPITWSLDTGRLTPAEAAVAKEQMTADFIKWGDASGLVFEYGGEVPVRYDDSVYSVTSDVHPSDRHVFVAFLHDADSTLLDERTVGFASPTKVFRNEKEIVEGSVVLSIEYVQKVNRLHRSSLYLHEIGHALGLGHGTDKPEVMYPIVDTTNDLSPADIAGIKALVRACKPAS